MAAVVLYSWGRLLFCFSLEKNSFFRTHVTLSKTDTSLLTFAPSSIYSSTSQIQVGIFYSSISGFPASPLASANPLLPSIDSRMIYLNSTLIYDTATIIFKVNNSRYKINSFRRSSKFFFISIYAENDNRKAFGWERSQLWYSSFTLTLHSIEDMQKVWSWSKKTPAQTSYGFLLGQKGSLRLREWIDFRFAPYVQKEFFEMSSTLDPINENSTCFYRRDSIPFLVLVM